MPCLFALFAVFTPRLAGLLLWLARPVIFTAPFNGGWFLPLLGVIFLPFTTIMYVLMWNPGTGLHGLDWLWLVLAVMCDLMHYGANGYQNRNQIPGMSQPSVPGPSGS